MKLPIRTLAASLAVAALFTAVAATFGSGLVDGEDGFYMDTRAVLAWDQPFDALAAVTDTGYINAMADGDGIIRSD